MGCMRFQKGEHIHMLAKQKWRVENEAFFLKKKEENRIFHWERRTWFRLNHYSQRFHAQRYARATTRLVCVFVFYRILFRPSTHATYHLNSVF